MTRKSAPSTFPFYPDDVLPRDYSGVYECRRCDRTYSTRARALKHQALGNVAERILQVPGAPDKACDVATYLAASAPWAKATHADAETIHAVLTSLVFAVNQVCGEANLPLLTAHLSMNPSGVSRSS